MAANSRCRAAADTAAIKFRQREDPATSPARAPEPGRRCVSGDERRIPVIYYLSRNGQLEHPHFMEVPLHPDAEGLLLRDVMNRLDFLRGKGMSGLYSWSSKRSYKNGFVWHDLAEDDLVRPAHGNEHVLKGSELMHHHRRPGEASTPSSPAKPPEASRSRDEPPEIQIPRRRSKAASWISLDKPEELAIDVPGASKTAEASTQSVVERKQRAAPPQQSELECVEISPPPSSSSSETLESLIKADSLLAPPPLPYLRPAAGCAGGRARASAVLMHLISCGSVSVKDGGVPLLTLCRPPETSLPPQPPRNRRTDCVFMKSPAVAGLPSVIMEDREYFSGSIVETKKYAGGADFAGIKRSCSFDSGERGSTAGADGREMVGVRARCIPTRSKRLAAAAVERTTSESISAHGSRRIDDTDKPRASKGGGGAAVAADLF